MVWLAVGFLVGTVAAAKGAIHGILVPNLLCTGALIVSFRPHNRVLTRIAAVILMMAGVGALMWNVRHTEPVGDPLCRHIAQNPGRYIIEGHVRLSDLEEVNPERFQFVVDADVARQGDKVYPLSGGVVVRWYRPGARVYAGERVRITGDMSVTLAAINPNTGSYEQYLRLRDIHSTISAGGPSGVLKVSDAPWSSCRYWASKLRLWQADKLARAVPEDTLPFVLACWLGFSQTVPADEYQTYVESGTAHILSVSGIHTAMVFMTVSFMLNLFLRNRRMRAALVMAAVMAFAIMAGVRLSGIRAALMVMIYMAAELVDREPDAPTALSLSSMLMLGWQPDALFDSGFQLSFLSMASILLFANPIYGFLNWAPRQIRGALSTALSVQVLPTPIAIGLFHVFPLGSIIANLAVVPLCTAALWLCFLTAAIAGLSPDVALLFGHALGPVVGLIRLIAKAVASPDFSYLTLTTPTQLAVFAYFGAVAFGMAAFVARRRRVYIMLFALAAIVSAVFWRPITASNPEVVFLDVGHGDATFVRTSDGRTVLADGGDCPPQIDAGRKIVAPFLWSNHVAHLDYVAVSHPDKDHIGGLFYVLDHFSVGAVLMSASTTDTKLESAFVAKCAAMNVPIYRMAAGQYLNLGDTIIEAVHPPPQWPASAEVNNKSLVLRLTMNEISLLLSGDMMASAEAAVAGKPDLCKADVLKVPHHGSDTSSSEALLAAVNPSFCVISTGGERGREAADRTVLERYTRHGVRILRTDLEGGIRLSRVDGQWTFEGTRQSLGYPRPMPAD